MTEYNVGCCLGYLSGYTEDKHESATVFDIRQYRVVSQVLDRVARAREGQPLLCSREACTFQDLVLNDLDRVLPGYIQSDDGAVRFLDVEMTAAITGMVNSVRACRRARMRISRGGSSRASIR